MIRLMVWLTDTDGTALPAGELVVGDPAENGALHGQFRYDPQYLHHPAAFALDPIHLPLHAGNFDADRPRAGVHGVFEDSLPDDWGRRLLARRHKLLRHEQRVPHLLRLIGAGGLGALSFSGDQAPAARQIGIAGHNLSRLLQLAEAFEKDITTVEDDLALLFAAGSSPGGARPKVVVEHEGKSWLAKFPSIRDQFDVVALEAASMHLARRAGVKAAHSELIACGSRRALLVERFDIAPGGGRRHMVSMQTLAGADGYYHLGYRDLSEIIRRISAGPAEDLSQLFKQMLFNILLGNTDDHLKNFCMLHGEEGWRLSPAFDLVPNIGQSLDHQLHIGGEFRAPDPAALLREAENFGIKGRQRAMKIIAEIHEIVAGWQDVFEHFKAPAADIEILGRDIKKRLSRLKQ
ncbi:MAG: type II toxin-antitoxin system HipA family toxin [Deltaproteobacteria bacterium]|nr:type II toxin-antitoxin system HipA family toxin [Deltaproteobacteria bacterium]